MPPASLQREPIGIFAENVGVGWTHASDYISSDAISIDEAFLVVSHGCKEVACSDKGRVNPL